MSDDFDEGEHNMEMPPMYWTRTYHVHTGKESS